MIKTADNEKKIGPPHIFANIDWFLERKKFQWAALKFLRWVSMFLNSKVEHQTPKQ